MKRAMWWIAGAALALPLLTACDGNHDSTLYTQQGPPAPGGVGQMTDEARRSPEEGNRSQLGIGGSFGSGEEAGGKYVPSGTEGGGTVMQGKENVDDPQLMYQKSP